ncbi:pyruvate, phosphate dikinase/phosphoenolpyruvate synthase regulator (plasmid) [Deinococcus radiomollis]|uniref:pyruvate, phosphate dikinase/phosphoenolpyruvate synthase regulator n=1 Tax=Deinococcus radiomollis TaxID=468916 RepID=UPI003891DF28
MSGNETESVSARPVLIVSDHTGITAESSARSLLAHFGGLFTYHSRPFVTTAQLAEQVAGELRQMQAEGPPPLVFATLTNPELLGTLQRVSALVFDLLGENLTRLEGILGQPAIRQVGGHHDMRDPQQYLARMDALDFTLSTDDGVGKNRYSDADIILVGVSRVGKTPTSLFLALQYGLRASNYPLADDDFASTELPVPLQPFQDRLYGLTIDARRLHTIRTHRKPGSRYASLEACEFEVRRAERLFQTQRLPMQNTTSASIEEIAVGILGYLKRQAQSGSAFPLP